MSFLPVSNSTESTSADAVKGASAVPDVECIIAFDMVRRSLPFVPVALLISGLIWGVNGALSGAYGIALALVNLVITALSLSWSAKRSLGLMRGVAMFGYLLRLILITVAVLAVHSQSWVKIIPLGLMIIVTHLGLLFWELRFASISFTFPGVKPAGRRVR